MSSPITAAAQANIHADFVFSLQETKRNLKARSEQEIFVSGDLLLLSVLEPYLKKELALECTLDAFQIVKLLSDMETEVFKHPQNQLIKRRLVFFNDLDYVFSKTRQFQLIRQTVIAFFGEHRRVKSKCLTSWFGDEWTGYVSKHKPLFLVVGDSVGQLQAIFCDLLSEGSDRAFQHLIATNALKETVACVRVADLVVQASTEHNVEVGHLALSLASQGPAGEAPPTSLPSASSQSDPNTKWDIIARVFSVIKRDGETLSPSEIEEMIKSISAAPVFLRPDNQVDKAAAESKKTEEELKAAAAELKAAAAESKKTEEEALKAASMLCAQIFKSLQLGSTVLSTSIEQPIFVVGDCLLIELIQSPLLSFSYGGQMLQLLHMVDQELQALASNGREVRVIFFGCLSFMWKNSLLAFARQILISQLSQQSQFILEYHDNWWCESWEMFLAGTLPTFLIVSSGNAAEQLSGAVKLAEFSDFAIQHLIMSILSRPAVTGPALNCVRFRDLVTEDHKSIGVVYSLPTNLKSANVEALLKSCRQLPVKKEPAIMEILDQWLGALPQIDAKYGLNLNSNPRLALTLFSLASAYKSSVYNNPKKKTAVEKKSAAAVNATLSKMLLIHTLLLQSLTLPQRVQPLEVGQNEQLLEFLPIFFEHAQKCLPKFLQHFKGRSSTDSLCDFFDGRLLTAVMSVLQEGFGAPSAPGGPSAAQPLVSLNLGWQDRTLESLYENFTKLSQAQRTPAQITLSSENRIVVPPLFPLISDEDLLTFDRVDGGIWWRTLDRERRSNIQRFIAEVSRLYPGQPQKVKSECIAKFQLEDYQYELVLTHLPTVLVDVGRSQLLNPDVTKYASKALQLLLEPPPMPMRAPRADAAADPQAQETKEDPESSGEEILDDWDNSEPEEPQEISPNPANPAAAADQPQRNLALEADKVFGDGRRGVGGFRVPTKVFGSGFDADHPIEIIDREEQGHSIQVLRAHQLQQAKAHSIAKVRLQDINVQDTNDNLDAESAEMLDKLLEDDNADRLKDLLEYFPGFKLKQLPLSETIITPSGAKVVFALRDLKGASEAWNREQARLRGPLLESGDWLVSFNGIPIVQRDTAEELERDAAGKLGQISNFEELQRGAAGKLGQIVRLSVMKPKVVVAPAAAAAAPADKEVSSSTDAPKDDDEDEKDEKVEVECAPSHSQKKPKRQGGQKSKQRSGAAPVTQALTQQQIQERLLMPRAPGNPKVKKTDVSNASAVPPAPPQPAAALEISQEEYSNREVVEVSLVCDVDSNRLPLFAKNVVKRLKERSEKCKEARGPLQSVLLVANYINMSSDWQQPSFIAKALEPFVEVITNVLTWANECKYPLQLNAAVNLCKKLYKNMQGRIVFIQRGSPNRKTTAAFDQACRHLEQLTRKTFEALDRVEKVADSFPDLEKKISKLDEDLNSLSLEFAHDRSEHLVLPSYFTLINWAKTAWVEVSSAAKQSGVKSEKTALQRSALQKATRLYHLTTSTFRRFKRFLTVEQMKELQRALYALGCRNTSAAARSMVDEFLQLTNEGVEFSEVFVEPSEVVSGISASYTDFQLDTAGHLLVRDHKSVKDPRVNFYPDDWQVKLLDVVDSGRSALLVAPTSAGKTFISDYCMKDVLNFNRTSTKMRHCVIYVAPIKALINQVEADLLNRYPDAEIDRLGELLPDLNTCEILLTIPIHIERIMLHPQFNALVRRVRYVVLDEIHCMGSEDGELWERALVMLPCPFIALSATISDPKALADWLNQIHKMKLKRWISQKIETMRTLSARTQVILQLLL